MKPGTHQEYEKSTNMKEMIESSMGKEQWDLHNVWLVAENVNVLTHLVFEGICSMHISMLFVLIWSLELIW